jgi:hypothetical protein
VYADELLVPWYEALRSSLPAVDVFDCHTHVGVNDPRGFSATADQLLDALALADARAAVFPLKEPGGYAEANLAVARLSAENPDRLVSFARLDPADEPLRQARDALAAGASGLKLHLTGEDFAVDDKRLEAVYAVADERQLPVIVHAGPELETLGESVLALLERHRGLRMILAHGALPDLAWLWREAPSYPNLFFDTSWWGASATLALFALVPPGRVLCGSDLPYCTPLSATMTALRCGAHAGLSGAQLASVVGGQFARLVQGEDPLDLGPPAGEAGLQVSILLERVFVTLTSAIEPLQRGEDAAQPLRIARQACRVPEDHPDAPVLRCVAALLDLYDDRAEELAQPNRYAPGWDLIHAAAVLARTPRAPVPSLDRMVAQGVARMSARRSRNGAQRQRGASAARGMPAVVAHLIDSARTHA